MKTCRGFLPFAIVTSLLLGAAPIRLAAQEQPRPGTGNPPVEISSQAKGLDLPGWGKITNPDGDCKFFVKDGELLMNVPGANGPHDLAADVNRINAPRVLQPARGDFTIQVQIDGRFNPSQESTLPGRVGYNGAALVAVLDPNNVVTLARAVMQYPSGEEFAYANFEMRLNGELLRIGSAGDHPLPKKGPLFLRLERRGQKFLGAVSTDGVTWDALEPKDVPAEWPKEMQVGVAAISTSKEEFNPRFSKLQVLK